MENPYTAYYLKQAGSGITGYSGNRYHVGNGFFGKILKNLSPALKYIGKTSWDTLRSIGSDVIGGDSLGTASKRNLLRTAQNVISDANEKLEEFKKRKQTGGGVKRKRRKTTKKRRVVKKATKKRKTKRVVRKPTKKVYKPRKKTTKRVTKKRKTVKKRKIVNFF